MFTLVRTLGILEALRREFVPLAVAFLIAEFFYKFHSFTLECGAFLLTWMALSYVQSLVTGAQEQQS
jgi:hypothetical protein